MKLEHLNRKWPVVLVAVFALVLPLSTAAEDIDIFVASSSGGGANVLVILDNTSNWADNAHRWPNGLLQRQAEVQALFNLVPTLDASINLGLMIDSCIVSGNQTTSASASAGGGVAMVYGSTRDGGGGSDVAVASATANGTCAMSALGSFAMRTLRPMG